MSSTATESNSTLSRGTRPPCLSRDDFELFARQYGGRLLAAAKRFFVREDDAADIVQEALLAAYRKLHTFRGDSTFYTWLYQIVVNQCLMTIRRNRRRTTLYLEEVLSTGNDSALSSNASTYVFWSRKSEEPEIDRTEVRELVQTCIEQLPEDQRTVILLRDIEQLDTQTTAKLLRLSRSAVKTRLHRAHKALRVLLDEAGNRRTVSASDSLNR